MPHPLLAPRRLFTAFKYAVYCALLANVWLYFLEDQGAAEVQLGETAGWSRFIEIFAQSIDTAAWLALLLLFELETSFLKNLARRSRRIAWTVHGLRGVCALVIVNSLIGYAGKFASYLDVAPFDGDPCALAGAGWSLMRGVDEFVALTAQNCAAADGAAYRLLDSPALAEAGVLRDWQRLALIDVINASAWILVVILLELDVRLQLRGLLDGWLLRFSTVLKTLTYAVLLLAAVAFGVHGDFLDFWDATLWLVAFVFIELNLFRWHEESAQQDAPAAAQPQARA